MRRLAILILLGVALLLAGGLCGAWAQNPAKTLQKVQGKVNPPPATPPGGAGAPPATVPGAQSVGTPGGESGAPPAAVPPGDEDNLLVEGELYYRHQNERDPFNPLVKTGAKGGPEVKVRPGTTGIARYTVEECILEAILQTPSEGVVAWFQGTDSKAYKVKVGERFADGVVIDISYDTGEVTIQQELNDPTAIKPFRNLVLKIRNQEGEGQ